MSSTSPPTNHMFHCWCVLPDLGGFVRFEILEVMDGSLVFAFLVWQDHQGGCVFSSTTCLGVKATQCRVNTRSLPFSGAAPVSSAVSTGGSVFFAHLPPLPGGGIF